MLTNNDLNQLQSKGITPQVIEKQIADFKNGFSFIDLQKPAIIGDGIMNFSEKEVDEFVELYETEAGKHEKMKFVPASGAATRMFKDLFSVSENASSFKFDKGDTNINSVSYLLKNINKLACFDQLKQVLNKNKLDIFELIKNEDFHTIIDFILSDKGLGYAQLPKGLLQFHRYTDYSRTSIEEHLVEGAHYAAKPDRSVEVHFTISTEHRDKIVKHISDIMPLYEKLFDVSYKITYSEQKPSTDTIAVDMDNQPFRESNGTLVFRPGGHGALIENLNDLKANIVFIKNIDNVVPDRLKQDTYKFKKLIGGILLSVRQKVFDYLNILEKGSVSDSLLKEIIAFAKNTLMIDITDDVETLPNDQLCSFIFKKLNRPIRICGMVKNVGEPGGGPFWVKNKLNETSLQIVESSQVDMNATEQKEIFLKATHFNPVDLVCLLRDYQGNSFNLLNFIDPETGFISIKSKNGHDLKALELPGLWNGAMADWITIFVEVPLITFNPVKTFNDLLREQHQ